MNLKKTKCRDERMAAYARKTYGLLPTDKDDPGAIKLGGGYYRW